MSEILLPKGYLVSMMLNIAAAIIMINGFILTEELVVKVVSLLVSGGLFHLSLVFRGFAEKGRNISKKSF